MNIKTLITIQRLLQDEVDELLMLRNSARERQYKAEESEEWDEVERYKDSADMLSRRYSEASDALRDFEGHEWQ